jgi:phage host-nuclease inhibitor protein Gam
LEQAGEAIKRIEAANVSIEEIVLKRDAEIDELKDKAARAILPHMRQATRDALVVERFARQNRAELTEGGKRKSASIFGWKVRWQPAKKVVFSRGGAKKALAFVLTKGKRYAKFVTYKPQLNKMAMHKDPKLAKSVPSVEGVQTREGFAILLLNGTRQLRRDPFSKKLKFEDTKKQDV